MRVITSLLAVAMIAHNLLAQQVIEESLSVQDSTRTYLLYIPAAYDGFEEIPLVVILHGHAQPFTILQMHGSADPLLPISGDGIIFTSASKTASFWGYNNQGSSDSTRGFPHLLLDDSSLVTTIHFNNCGRGTEVLFNLTEGEVIHGLVADRPRAFWEE